MLTDRLGKRLAALLVTAAFALGVLVPAGSAQYGGSVTPTTPTTPSGALTPAAKKQLKKCRKKVKAKAKTKAAKKRGYRKCFKRAKRRSRR